ncbi:hypothetical protein EVAR_21612_1 [Eumeta japonica]|uniref:Uncharacterized protein n=1 Tax=Eumeta variegata TaxID=151549 RepID=A0A4C1UZE5_EUMVA|nr:hypothetical protein EVAR_21612_1 [Eumeta japonica]
MSTVNNAAMTPTAGAGEFYRSDQLNRDAKLDGTNKELRELLLAFNCEHFSKKGAKHLNLSVLYIYIYDDDDDDDDGDDDDDDDDDDGDGDDDDDDDNVQC